MNERIALRESTHTHMHNLHKSIFWGSSNEHRIAPSSILCLCGRLLMFVFFWNQRAEQLKAHQALSIIHSSSLGTSSSTNTPFFDHVAQLWSKQSSGEAEEQTASMACLFELSKLAKRHAPCSWFGACRRGVFCLRL